MRFSLFAVAVLALAANAYAAPALDGHIVLSRIKGYDTRFESVPNGDGTVTFKATCRRIGFVISFR